MLCMSQAGYCSAAQPMLAAAEPPHGLERGHARKSLHALTIHPKLTILTLQVGYCSAAQTVLAVTEAPRVAWSEAAHAEFPRSFRAAAACLLLCLHHLSMLDTPPVTQPSAGSAFGCFLPPPLVRASLAGCSGLSPRLSLRAHPCIQSQSGAVRSSFLSFAFRALLSCSLCSIAYSPDRQQHALTELPAGGAQLLVRSSRSKPSISEIKRSQVRRKHSSPYRAPLCAMHPYTDVLKQSLVLPCRRATSLR